MMFNKGKCLTIATFKNISLSHVLIPIDSVDSLHFKLAIFLCGLLLRSKIYDLGGLLWLIGFLTPRLCQNQNMIKYILKYLFISVNSDDWRTVLEIVFQVPRTCKISSDLVDTWWFIMNILWYLIFLQVIFEYAGIYIPHILMHLFSGKHAKNGVISSSKSCTPSLNRANRQHNFTYNSLTKKQHGQYRNHDCRRHYSHPCTTPAH